MTIYSQISQQEAALSTAQANLQQAKQNYISQVAAAGAAVSDSQSKVDSAAAAIHAAQAAVLSDQAQLEYANSNLTRYQSLYKQGFVSTQQLDNARTQLTVEQAAVKASQEQLKSAESLKNSAQEEWKASEDELKITQTQGKTGIQNSQNSLKQVASSLASAKANTAQDPAYLANVAALKAAVVASVGLLQNAQAQLANNIIRSSIDGYVTARDADPGAAVTAGEPLLEIQSLDKVYVSVSVPEEVIRHLSVGQSGLVDMDGLPGRHFTGLITRINPAGDPASRQFTVYITLNNPRRIIKPGMYARVTFITEKISGALTVPREAIVQGKNGPYVVVVEKGIARIRPVKTVGDQTALVQVVSGLKAGEQVVVLSVSALKAGQHVKPAAFSPLASSAGLSE